ncbi:MAG: sterol desaturase family protein [Myxococcaceae bacterium]|nr:sterol desaturase family protein [Myxococcaceae bacterium]
MIAFILGGVAWAFSEYLIHKYVGHGPRLEPSASWWRNLTPRGLAAQFNFEHLSHHADPSYFAATWRKVVAALVAVPLVGGIASLAVGVERGVSFASGYAVVYAVYEVLHRRIHSSAPLGAYGRWLRRHHLLHHYRTPRENFGVTTPVFDVLFGSHAPAAPPLKVPRRTAPKWLVDESGNVRERYRPDYQV